MRKAKISHQAGETYGRLTLVKPAPKRYNQISWECLCECGNSTVVTADRLRRGHTKSCGCIQREVTVERNKKMFKRNKKPEGISAMNCALKTYRYHARMRNYEWLLTEEQGHILLKGNCYYCGIEPCRIQESPRGSSTATVNGIDRVDNNQGYTLENSVSCCSDCNMMKKTMSVEKFLEIVSRIYKHQSLKC